MGACSSPFSMIEVDYSEGRTSLPQNSLMSQALVLLLNYKEVRKILRRKSWLGLLLSCDLVSLFFFC
jgi:hypothetical protein